MLDSDLLSSLDEDGEEAELDEDDEVAYFLAVYFFFNNGDFADCARAFKLVLMLSLAEGVL